MTTTTKTTIPALTEELQNLAVGYPECQPIIRSVVGSELYKAWNPSVTGTVENAYFGDTLELKTKEEYIDMRDTLKGWLRLMEAYQRALKAQCSRPGDQSMPQMYKHRGSQVVTQLIEIRRAGKVWSAAQAKTKLEAAA
jgi:hypothetical protein